MTNRPVPPPGRQTIADKIMSPVRVPIWTPKHTEEFT